MKPLYSMSVKIKGYKDIVESMDNLTILIRFEHSIETNE